MAASTDKVDTHGHTLGGFIGQKGILLDNDDFTALNLTGVAATDLLTSDDDHFLKVGDWVRLSGLTGGAGLVEGTRYMVETVPSATTFTLARHGKRVGLSSDLTAGTFVRDRVIGQTDAEVAAQKRNKSG